MASLKITNLSENSLQFSTQTHFVRVDDEPEASNRDYLMISGSPEAYRWLAQRLQSMANSVEKSDDPKTSLNVIVSPHDLPQVSMSQWHSLELQCRSDISD